MTIKQLFIAIFLSFVFVLPTKAGYAQKSISEVIEKQKTAPAMKTMSFGKKKKDPASETEKSNEKGASGGYEEIEPAENLNNDDNQEVKNSNAEKVKKEAPEEDVWEKYKTLAAGKPNKKMSEKSYNLNKKRKKAENSEEDIESDQDSAHNVKDADDGQEDKKTEKKGIAKILEDYENRDKKNAGIKTRALNE